MPTLPPAVPRVRYDGPAAKNELVVVVERVLYILRWLADNPTALLDGRHHDTLRNALEDLETVAGAPGPAWKDAIQGCDDKALEGAGLAGNQLALKLGIFNQLFDEFLDMIADRGSNDQQLMAKQLEDFKARVLPWYRRPLRRGATITRALKAGTTIVSSIASALGTVPYVKGAFEALKELSEFVQHAIAHLDTKR